jgi:N-ethylmaleimide reductase
MTDLFTPMDLHGLALPRIWMSTMTRTRATEDNVPTPLMGEYYGQGATARLIVTECTAV